MKKELNKDDKDRQEHLYKILKDGIKDMPSEQKVIASFLWGLGPNETIEDYHEFRKRTNESHPNFEPTTYNSPHSIKECTDFFNMRRNLVENSLARISRKVSEKYPEAKKLAKYFGLNFR